MNIKIGDRVIWTDSNKFIDNGRIVGVVENVLGNVAIVRSGGLKFKLYVTELTLADAICLTRDDYRKKVLSVADDAGCNEDTEEANALREIANVLFEQFEIALFGECDKALECFSNKTSD